MNIEKENIVIEVKTAEGVIIGTIVHAGGKHWEARWLYAEEKVEICPSIEDAIEAMTGRD